MPNVDHLNPKLCAYGLTEEHRARLKTEPRFYEFKLIALIAIASFL